jgi:hypothetical protein
MITSDIPRMWPDRPIWHNCPSTSQPPSTAKGPLIVNPIESTVRRPLAERKGFEPPVPEGTADYQSAALNHSATSVGTPPLGVPAQATDHPYFTWRLESPTHDLNESSLRVWQFCRPLLLPPPSVSQLRFAGHMLDDAVSALRRADKAQLPYVAMWIEFAQMNLQAATQRREKTQATVDKYGGPANVVEVGA